MLRSAGAPCSANTKRSVRSSAFSVAIVICVLVGPRLLAQPPKPSGAGATTSDVHHLLGLDEIKRNAKGKLTIQNGAMQFDAGKKEVKVPTASIEGIFSGEETTQALGAVGTIGKVAAPYGGGRVLSLLLRTKVDVLTLAYRDANGAFHGVIFTLPKGQAAQVRAQLVAEGARAGMTAGVKPAQEGAQ